MSRPQILINQMSYSLPTGNTIFNGLSLSFSKLKTGLVGKNGIGKSTLIKLILSEIYPNGGSIHIEGKLAYVSQIFSLSSEITLSGLFGCAEKIAALQRIIKGSVEENDFSTLNEEWNIEERMQTCLASFGLDAVPYNRQLKMLSGGELTRVLLAKTFFSNADFLLLDEPTNNLDYSARQQLYDAIKQWEGGLIVISHDRTLLNLMDEIVELNTLGVRSYGGNYDFFTEKKEIEKLANEHHLRDAKKLMEKTKATIQSSREKHEKKQSYGNDLRKSGRIDKIAANSKKGRSERTQKKLLIKEERLLNQAENQIKSTKEKLEITDTIHVLLPATKVPSGKAILNIQNLIFSYVGSDKPVINNFNLKIHGPIRVALSGNNGSGKTTLIKLILGSLKPSSGTVQLGTEYIRYLDQDASLLNPELSILENFLLLNPDTKENHAYRCLAKFLFKNVSALKLVKNLSGGEKIRALLACALMSKHPPQLLILDEPTNHLDLDSIKSIESALNNYQGAMIIVSHDQLFLKNIGTEKIIHAPFDSYNPENHK